MHQYGTLLDLVTSTSRDAEVRGLLACVGTQRNGTASAIVGTSRWTSLSFRRDRHGRFRARAAGDDRATLESETSPSRRPELRLCVNVGRRRHASFLGQARTWLYRYCSSVSLCAALYGSAADLFLYFLGADLLFLLLMITLSTASCIFRLAVSFRPSIRLGK